MKKLFMSVLILSFISSLISAGGIAVVSPNGSDEWLTGSNPEITWNYSRDITVNVKIRLFDFRGTKVLNIADNIVNNGSFKRWRIPHSVSSGQYRIRVKTVNNNIWDDSELFRIRKGLIMKNNLDVMKENLLKKKLKIIDPIINPDKFQLKLPDFYITDMFISKDKYLVITYANKGFYFEGDLELNFIIKGSNITQVKKIVIGPGTHSMWLTRRLLLATDISGNGKINVNADVNPRKNVLEKDTNNNTFYKELIMK